MLEREIKSTDGMTDPWVYALYGLKTYPKIAQAAIPGGEDAASSIIFGQALSPEEIAILERRQ